jgi:hypothetical protein
LWPYFLKIAANLRKIYRVSVELNCLILLKKRTLPEAALFAKRVFKTTTVFKKIMSFKTILFACIFPVLILCNSCRENTGAGDIWRDTVLKTEADSQLSAASKPVVKDTADYDTILIEGTRQPVKLMPYSEPNYGIKTFIPERDFLPETSASGEGMAVKFIANFGGRKNENAYVNVFFPAGNPGLDQLRDMTIGPRGLLAMNKWRLMKSFKKPDVPYGWAQEYYTFQHKDGSNYSSGSVLIGESKGRTVQVAIHYPAEYADGFMPRANILLKNLRISPLPETGF